MVVVVVVVRWPRPGITKDGAELQKGLQSQLHGRRGIRAFTWENLQPWLDTDAEGQAVNNEILDGSMDRGQPASSNPGLFNAARFHGGVT